MTEPFIPLGAFQLSRRIGHGGMAEVWSGVHTAQGVPVAVKVMTAPSFFEDRYRAAFRNEVRAVASLNHPGIIIVLDYGEVSPEAAEISEGRLPVGSPFLAMELADAGTLPLVFSQREGWPGLRRVLLLLLDALAHAHARGVIHRDLKPSNVLAFGERERTRLKLADFGLAHAVEPGELEPNEPICGTPSYIAPEQLRGEWRDYGPWTDLYSLGCMAWSLATGHPPFLGRMADVVRRHLEEKPPAFQPLFPVPRGLEGWLRRLLAKDPGQRFQRAADAAWSMLGIEDAALAPSSPPEADAEADATPALLLTLPAMEGQAAAPSPAGLLLPSLPAPLPRTWESPVAPPPSMRLVGAGLGLYGLRSISFIGRQRERDALWRALTEVHDRRETRLVLLLGAAGNGKTRLAEWIAERAHEVGGATILRATHSPEPGAGDGLARMITRQTGCVGLTSAALASRIQRLLARLGLRDEADQSGMLNLLTPGRSRQTSRERFDLLTRYLRQLGRQRPLLLVLDDVQWSVETIEFARHLLEESAEEPIPALLLLTAREEALAERRLEGAALEEVMGSTGSLVLDVPPLSADERTALIGDLLGLSPELVAAVDARTEGNPLFAVQLVGDLVHRGLLEVDKAGFVLRPGAEIRLPDNLHQVWSGRVARLLEPLPAGAREALEIAAALGSSVDRGEWEGACRTTGVSSPPQLLDHLLASRLAVATEEGWRFVHPMLRESVERLAREACRWPACHRACAAMLAARSGERGVAERLGRHLLQAGELAAAVAPLLSGARERNEASDFPLAHEILTLREETLDALGIHPRDPQRGEGWVLRARISFYQGRMQDVFRWAGRVVSGGTEGAWSPHRAEALRLLGDTARRRGHLDEALRLYQRCIEVGSNPRSAAACHWGFGEVCRLRGDLAEARAFLAQSLALYREAGDQHGAADYLIGLARVERLEGNLKAAADLYGEAEARFRELRTRYGVARSINGQAEIARVGGDFPRARELARRALSLLEKLSTAAEIFPRVNLGLIALAEESFIEASAILEASRATLESLDWGALLATVQAALLPCAAQSGRWSSWDESLAFVTTTISASGLADADVAFSAELAGRVASAAEPVRARAAWELARDQWRRLGNAAGARQVEEALLRLPGL
ncbi:MAG TPA: tetratricopeptide repeat protein [Thermoanaerobaculia bacterium]|nr:tetratricopeptide repeat protein [Thermoanaerobaculia bacterium]